MALAVMVLLLLGTFMSASGSYSPDVRTEWEGSEHANSYDEGQGANTYCAQCKSPGNWDPEATYGNYEVVAEEDWEGITCGDCHSILHDFENPNELCESCHEGSRHESVYTPGFGKNMFKKGVECLDCHMPDVPHEVYSPGEHASHSWEIIPEYSCGVENDDCHVNKDVEWAEKQIEKDNVHLVGYDTDAQQHWQDNQGQTKDKDK
jgi:hypothetical protein